MKIQQNNIISYLAVTAGVGCVSSAANAAVVFYGNASNTNIQADPSGISFDIILGYYNNFRGLLFSGGTRLGSGGVMFTTGSDIIASSTHSYASYATATGPLSFQYGARAGALNYANISFDGSDGVHEAVAQFYFDGVGGGYLMAIATTNPIPNPQNLSAVGGPALSISAGKAMIDAAAVPEPTSLGLLALGALGLATRRQRRKAA